MLVSTQLCPPADVVLPPRPQGCDHEFHNAFGRAAIFADSFERIGKHVDVV